MGCKSSTIYVSQQVLNGLKTIEVGKRTQCFVFVNRVERQLKL